MPTTESNHHGGRSIEWISRRCLLGGRLGTVACCSTEKGELKTQNQPSGGMLAFYQCAWCVALIILVFRHLQPVEPRFSQDGRSVPFRGHSRTVASFVSIKPEKYRRKLSSVRGTTSPWTVGDAVMLLQGEHETAGIIQEDRGRGWYSVLFEGNSTIKCRSSQMKRAEVPPDISNHEFNSSVHIDNLDELVGQKGPTSENIDCELTLQLNHFSTYRQWVVFSDLHCSPATLDSAVQVLQHVHEAAVNRSAGILFLGDFFHHRNTLSVDMLNVVLKELAKFRQPAIVIPGNHDQTRLSGENHALMLLQHAYRVQGKHTSVPGVLVLSYPTTFMKALFIPHLKEQFSMKSILQRYNSTHHSVIFCHVDVSGAAMNDGVVSRGGISPAFFPASVPVYSGHYHKPHTVRNSKIHYVGSPYQVSLSEAQQEKALLVLDADRNWTPVETIPLSIGRRNFRPADILDFLSLSATTNTDRPTATVRAGDRVVFSIDQHELEEMRRQQDGHSSVLDNHVSILRDAGVRVEIREIPAERTERDSAPLCAHSTRDMSAVSLWSAFLNHQILRGAMANETYEELEKEGLRVIEALHQDATHSPGFSEGFGADLQLRSVTLEGFGPFQKKFYYPLLNRGLVLLRGSNEDDGADSNGSGKTSLAMSILWAFTGSLDARPSPDASVTDIINDSSKTASVKIEGTINGKEFVICRTKTATKGNLVFWLDGIDRSTQSIKETQRLINETMNVYAQLLIRTIFHGQHALNELLEATDTKLKEEMSLLVPLEIWQSAVKYTREQARSVSKRIHEVEGMLSLRMGDTSKLKHRLFSLEAEFRQKEALFNATMQRLKVEMERFETTEDTTQRENSAPNLGLKLQSIEKEIIELQKALTKNSEVCDGKIADLESQLDEQDKRLQDAEATCEGLRQIKRKRDTKVALAKEKLLSLERLWNIDSSSLDFWDEFSIPQKCPTCNQPLTSLSSNSSCHEDLGSIIKRDISEAHNQLLDAESKLKDVARDLHLSDETRKNAKVDADKARIALDDIRWHLSSVKDELSEKLRSALESQKETLSELAAAAKQDEKESRRDSLRSQIKAEESSIAQAKAAVESHREEIADYEEVIEKLRLEERKHSRFVKVLGELSDAFGQRGIQSFVLQNVVAMLESVSNFYLNQLSEGAMKLQLSLDSSDRILKRAFVLVSKGQFKERPLASLSGGQWRRCSLALSLGFADLATRFGKLRTSLCVMDEPLTHLDQTGRADVGRVFRSLIRRTFETEGEGASGFQVSTLLIVLQDLAAEELEESFDCIDEVVKRDGSSSVVIDE